jgi:hypothetical protein
MARWGTIFFRRREVVVARPETEIAESRGLFDNFERVRMSFSRIAFAIRARKTTLVY